jgi:hypothetical protein
MCLKALCGANERQIQMETAEVATAATALPTIECLSSFLALPAFPLKLSASVRHFPTRSRITGNRNS